MLINIVGIWLMAANISFMEPVHDGCKVYFDGSVTHRFAGITCEQLALKINTKLIKVR